MSREKLTSIDHDLCTRRGRQVMPCHANGWQSAINAVVGVVWVAGVPYFGCTNRTNFFIRTVAGRLLPALPHDKLSKITFKRV